jgi:hypothetical protein
LKSFKSQGVIRRFGNPESKHVGGNLGFETCPNINGDLGSGDYPDLNRGSNCLEILSPNMSGVIWGLEIIQISNRVIQRFGNPESKHVGGNLGFGDYPNLKLGGPTV